MCQPAIGLQRLVTDLCVCVTQTLGDHRFPAVDFGSRCNHGQAPDLVVFIGNPGLELGARRRARGSQGKRGESPDPRQLVGILGASLENRGGTQPVERGRLQLRDLAALASQCFEPFGGAEQRVDLNPR